MPDPQVCRVASTQPYSPVLGGKPLGLYSSLQGLIFQKTRQNFHVFHVEFHFQIGCWKYNGGRWMGKRNLTVSTHKFGFFGLEKIFMHQNVFLFLQ